MEVKAAVKLAKRHVEDLFSDEQIDEIGLEETEFDDSKDEWHITIGFRRTFLSNSVKGKRLAFPVARAERSFKVVQIRDRDGKILGVVDRILRDAA